MTDTKRLADLARLPKILRDWDDFELGGVAPPPLHYDRIAEDIELALSLLDTTRSDRDAALARVGILEESVTRAAGNMDGVALALELSETIDATAFATNLRAFAKRARVALTPPAYPPEQPL